MPQGTTYSFLDTVGSFNHPLAGQFTITGQANGIGEFVIENTTDRTSHDVSSDGLVVVNYISGSNGSIEIHCQQTSALHKFLLSWYNLVENAAENGDPSNWATATIVLRNVVDGGQHNLSGVSPMKVPTKTYAQKQTNVSWHLPAAQVSQVALPNL